MPEHSDISEKARQGSGSELLMTAAGGEAETRKFFTARKIAESKRKKRAAKKRGGGTLRDGIPAKEYVYSPLQTV